MKCNQCMAEYAADLLQCPYCHSENKKEADRQKRKILVRYDKEASYIKKEAEKYPKKAANKWTAHILTGIVIIFAVGIAAIVLYLVCSRVFAKMAYNAQETHMASLEEFYQAGDYKALSTYMDEKNLYQSTYDKYSEICRIYNNFERMDTYFSYMQEINTYEEHSTEEKWNSFSLWADSYLTVAGEIVCEADNYMNDKVFHTNEEVIEVFRQETIADLYECGFSEEEIERICQDEPEELKDLEEKLFDVLIVQ